jgi:RNA polymerase sigma-70 factor (ECF subfamily)
MLVICLAALDTEDEKLKMADIYERHKSVMLSYALSITKNRELAEDAVHDAFLAVIKHKEKYFALSCRDLRISIVIITKHKCIDLLRQRNRFADEPPDDTDSVSNDDLIEEKLILKEEYETIKRHVASLDEMSRLVLEMKYLLGMSYKEIGERLGISPKHVDTRIMRAKAKVRGLVERHGEPIG